MRFNYSELNIKKRRPWWWKDEKCTSYVVPRVTASIVSVKKSVLVSGVAPHVSATIKKYVQASLVAVVSSYHGVVDVNTSTPYYVCQ